MKRVIAMLGFVGVLSVGTVHAQGIEVTVFTSPESDVALRIPVDMAIDGQVVRVVSQPIVACVVDKDACEPIMPGETLTVRSGQLTILPTERAGRCSSDENDADDPTTGSLQICSQH